MLFSCRKKNDLKVITLALVFTLLIFSSILISNTLTQREIKTNDSEVILKIGSNLEGDSWDTKKLKEKNKSYDKINKNEHQLVFTFEKRKGKPVTLVGRFYMSDKEKKDILKLLKKKLACGGAVKDEWIELQGEVKDKIKDILLKDGWKFK